MCLSSTSAVASQSTEAASELQLVLQNCNNIHQCLFVEEMSLFFFPPQVRLPSSPKAISDRHSCGLTLGCTIFLAEH